MIPAAVLAVVSTAAAVLLGLAYVHEVRRGREIRDTGTADHIRRVKAEARAEELARLLEREEDPLRVALREANERVDRLTQQIVELRREGFNPPPPEVEYRAQPGIPTIVAEAINAVTPPGSTERQEETMVALGMLERGAEAEDVAAAIRRGGDYNPFR